MKKLLSITFITLAVTMILPLASSSARVTEEQKRKADYIYMEAVKQNALSNSDAYYSMLKRVCEVNTEETSPFGDLGMLSLYLQSAEDSMAIRRGLDLMKAHYETHPDDYYSALRLATVLTKLGMVSEALDLWEKLNASFPTKDEVTFNYGNALMNSPKLENKQKAIEVFDNLEKAVGKSLTLTINKINTYFALSDTSSVLKEINSFLDYAPKDVDAIIAAGDIRNTIDQPDSALIYYQRACQTDSTSGIAYYKLAEFYLNSGDSVAYDREIFHAMGLSSLDVNTKAELLRNYIVNLYSDPSQTDRIHSLFAKLIEQHPHESIIHRLYASYLVTQKEFSKAAEQQSYALDIDHGEVNDWMGLLSLRMQADEFDTAEKDADLALSYFGNKPELLWYKAIIQTQEEKFSEALESAKMALMNLNDMPNRELTSQIYSTSGDIYYKLNMPDSAFISYEKSLELNPGNLGTMNNYAYFLACEGKDLERALELSGKTIAADPTNSTTLDTYAWVQFKLHNFDIAKEYIDKALENDENPSAELYHHAGDIYFLCGDPDGAVKLWQQALELEPDNKLLIKKIKNRAFSYD
ncbi:MAG: tetratricopeptide repeat protein [Muribaculaceae bacterium]|nr:tetratricopeptide repeat protein [Muribaculaceae bacterium]